MKKDDRRLRIGLLGCGPIAQAAHLDAIRKARNADLYAICDVARGLTDRLAAMCQPQAVYNDFAAILADPRVEAVVIARGSVRTSGGVKRGARLLLQDRAAFACPLRVARGRIL